MFHLVIVECESTLTPVVAGHGSQGAIIEAMLRRNADKGPPSICFSHWNAVHMQSYPSLDGVDAMFFTGGGYAAYDNHPWSLRLIDLIRAAYAQQIPLVGICYGFQLMSRALGGLVTENPMGSELTVTNVTLTPLGQELIGDGSLKIHQMHLDAVVALPAGTEIIGSSDKCNAQLVYQKDRLLGIQGHPEVDGALVTHMLGIRLREGLISQATYDMAIAKVEASHDGDKLAAFVNRFLRPKPSQVA